MVLRLFLVLSTAVAGWTVIHYAVHLALPDTSLVPRFVDLASLPLALLASWLLIRRVVIPPKTRS